MTRTSARVEINGQQNGNGFIGGLCCPRARYIKVDRKFPQILEYYKTVHEWTEACQKFDKAFIPINNAHASCFLCLDKTARVFFVIGIVLVLMMDRVVPYIFTFGSLAYMIFRIVSKELAWKMVTDKLRKYCGRESEINEAVSFHLRQEESLRWRAYYIECIVELANNGNGDSLESGMHTASIPVATVVSVDSIDAGAAVVSSIDAEVVVASAPPARIDGGAGEDNGGDATLTRSSDDRLRDLESIASLLTEEEYNSSLELILSGGSTSSLPDGRSIVDQIEELERSRQSLQENDYKTKKSNLLKQI